MDLAKKKQMKKIVSWALLAALVVGLATMPLMAKAEAEANGPVATVHSGTVEEGSIRTALHGGGTLVTEDVEEVKLPSGVKITEFLVKNGDTVTEGTPLAAVDKVSVMTAITSVTDTLDYLQKELRSAKDEKVSSTVSATAGGRVKKVFAQKGDSVQEVMLRDGALALLSLDGLMAVKIEKKLSLLTGETVTVTLADETEVTGRVASNLDGVIVITIEDDGYEIGQTVAVTAKDGSDVGSGELYVHNAWTASAFSGVIQSAPAKEETKVTAGTTLFTLTETDFKGQLEYLSSLHREYEDLMQDLFKMYNSGTIDAPCDGTISGIDKDSPHLLAAISEEPLEASLLRVEESSWTVVLLGDLESAPVNDIPCDSEDPNCPHTECIKACTHAASKDQCKAKSHHDDCIHACANASVAGTCPGTGAHTVECIESCHPDKGICTKEGGYHKLECVRSCKKAKASTDPCKDTTYPHYLDCIMSCVTSDGSRDCPASIHHAACIENCKHAQTAGVCRPAGHHYPDCIELCIVSDSGGKECPASVHKDTCFFKSLEYTAKVALVNQVGSSELVVSWDASNQEYSVEKVGAGWKFTTDQGFNLDLLVNKGTVAVSNPKNYRPGDVIFVVTGYRGKEAVWTGIPVYIRGAGKIDGSANLDGLMNGLTDMLTPQMPDLSALMGQFAGFGNFGFYAPPTVEEEKLFDLEGSTLMSVSPQERVSLTITLDEQDIARISTGQRAAVKVEALGGEVFEAEVTEVSGWGSNSGGSSKFTAKLELPKAANMLDGMSATASLPLQETGTVPTIPVVALAEQGSRTVVYTALDEEGNPANPVPVTVGLSDGINAEILEGLSVGDTYYYSYYDVLEEDTGVEERFTLT